MSHIKIDNAKALKKWTPVLENMGVKDETRMSWMAEMAEFQTLNENAYANQNINGMGNVISAQPGTYPGSTLAPNYPNGNIGSGDLGQNLLPVAMKIAAQTIGLDLVAVKPTPGPKIDLLYIDFQYDDIDTTQNDERPQVFKFSAGNTTAVVAGLTAALASASITEVVGGLSGRLWVNISAGTTTTTEPAGSKEDILEFLGFSRIDGFPMFRAYRQYNTASSGGWVFDQTKNTFNATQSMSAQIQAGSFNGVTPTATVTVELVSVLEDQIPGFSANWVGPNNMIAGAYGMNRGADDQAYAGNIGPKVSSKTVAVGTIEVSSALKRTEIEDIKANTGMDIVQKMESVLVNELSQTISRQIVAKIFELGDLNRVSAPKRATANIVDGTVFDLDTAYVAGVGGETTHAVQRKLITKMLHASNYIATEGRVGPATFAVTNGALGASLMDIAGYAVNPVKSKLSGSGQLYPIGQVGDISVYVDPYMKYNDNRIVVGRKNNADMPGVVFIPYLMAQQISIVSESTFAPRILLRSRYAIAELGFYPQKQYMTIKVADPSGYLN